MPKFINRYVGKLVNYERKSDDKDFSYALGRLGYIEFYESEKKHPGMIFVRYFFNLDGEFDYRDEAPDITTHYIFTSCGELDIDGNTFTLRTLPNGSTFEFEMKCGG